MLQLRHRAFQYRIGHIADEQIAVFVPFRQQQVIPIRGFR